ncbi:MAG TPA: S1C family serine protease [Opitutaceae bacterium]
MLPLGGRLGRQFATWRGTGVLLLALAGESLPVRASQMDAVDLFQKLSQAVVRVVIAEEPNDDGLVTKWAFSGFFIDAEGRVLTNSASGAPISRIWVEKDGLSYLAELIGSDPQTNVALLQLVKLPEKFETIPLLESSQRPPIATPILRIASPLELEPSPAVGLITGYESSLPSGVFPFTYTRVNLSAGLGDGGSLVVDADGRLVGITVASVPEISSSYLIPANALRRIVEDLAQTGAVSYGTLPIEFVERADPTNVIRQIVIASVVPESSASRADVRPGDVVRRLGSTAIRRIHDVRDELFSARPGQFITLEVERNGKRIPFALPVESRAEKHRPPPVPPPTDVQQEGEKAETPRLRPPTRPSESDSYHP